MEAIADTVQNSYCQLITRAGSSDLRRHPIKKLSKRHPVWSLLIISPHLKSIDKKEHYDNIRLRAHFDRRTGRRTRRSNFKAEGGWLLRSVDLPGADQQRQDGGAGRVRQSAIRTEGW